MDRVVAAGQIDAGISRKGTLTRDFRVLYPTRFATLNAELPSSLNADVRSDQPLRPIWGGYSSHQGGNFLKLLRF